MYGLIWNQVNKGPLDDQIARVQALGVGVGFRVFEERQEKLGGLDRPPCS